MKTSMTVWVGEQLRAAIADLDYSDHYAKAGDTATAIDYQKRAIRRREQIREALEVEA